MHQEKRAGGQQRQTKYGQSKRDLLRPGEEVLGTIEAIRRLRSLRTPDARLHAHMLFLAVLRQHDAFQLCYKVFVKFQKYMQTTAGGQHDWLFS